MFALIILVASIGMGSYLMYCHGRDIGRTEVLLKEYPTSHNKPSNANLPQGNKPFLYTCSCGKSAYIG